jgi:ABC-type Zn uptake system ZnuABC Zn-binding protein ZnuA
MKKFFFLAFFIILFSPSFAKIKVVATASIFMDMAKNIGGDKIDVQTIVPIGADPHIYEPTPADAALVASADILLKNGLTFEGWLNELMENSGTKAKIVVITNGVAPITSPEFHNSTDPHAWMSVYNAFFYIHNIKKALCEYDPTNRDFYEKNYSDYRAKLVALDKEVAIKINSIPIHQRVLITSHDAFQYFGRHYMMRVFSVLGTSTDADVQTSDLIKLNKIIRQDSVAAVFIESTINPKLLNQIAKDNHCIIGGKLYADSIGDENSPAPTYEAMIRHNTDQIVNALMKKNTNPPTYEPLPLGSYVVIAAILLAVFAYVFFKIKK